MGLARDDSANPDRTPTAANCVGPDNCRRSRPWHGLPDDFGISKSHGSAEFRHHHAASPGRRSVADHFRRCELFDLPADEARRRFRQFMEMPAAPGAALFPGKLSAVSNVPIRVPEHFLGREDAIDAIDLALKRYEGRVAITAL